MRLRDGAVHLTTLPYRFSVPQSMSPMKPSLGLSRLFLDATSKSNLPNEEAETMWSFFGRAETSTLIGDMGDTGECERPLTPEARSGVAKADGAVEVVLNVSGAGFGARVAMCEVTVVSLLKWERKGGR